MYKKGYISIESVLTGVAVITLGFLIATAVVNTTNNTLNGVDDFTDNIINPREEG